MTIAASIAVVAPAAAEDSVRLQIGRPDHGARIDRMAVSAFVDGTRVVTTFTLAVVGVDRGVAGARDVTIPIAVPAGTPVYGLSLPFVDGRRLARSHARTAYEETMREPVDPALLEWQATTAGVDRISLRLFPVTATATNVSFSIELPLVASAVVDLGAQHVARVDVATTRREITWRQVGGSRTVPLVEPTAMPERSRLHAPLAIAPRVPPRVHGGVDRGHSIVAGTRPDAVFDAAPVVAAIAPPAWLRPDPVTIHIPQPTVAPDCFRGRPIRRFIKTQHARLRRCYMLEAQRDPSLAGTVTLTFAITPDGKVTTATAGGELTRNESIRSCLVDEMMTWRFAEEPASAGITQVTYPLTFRLGNAPPRE